MYEHLSMINKTTVGPVWVFTLLLCDRKENSFEQIQTLKPKTVGEETANTTAKV